MLDTSRQQRHAKSGFGEQPAEQAAHRAGPGDDDMRILHAPSKYPGL